MSEFERRWQACAEDARRVTPPPAEPPPGFVARVLARRDSPDRTLPVSALWERLGWRAVVAVTAVLLVMAALDYRDRPAAGLRVPHVERTVAAAFWML